MKQILLMIMMTLTAATMAFAQRGRNPEVAPPQGVQRRMPPDPTAGLQAALNLTDAQVDAIKALMATRNERAQEIRTEIEQKRAALDALLDAESPIPVNVGNAAISLRASQRRIAAEREWFVTELKKLLTGDQQQKLDTLLAANPRLPLLGGPGGGRGGNRRQ
jgi:Spy/CpxP family protein refolding chaperone